MKTEFTGTVRGEGKKHYPMLIVPAASKVSEGWTRVQIQDESPCFLYIRGKAPRLALPAWRFPKVRIGDVLRVRLEPSESYRASGAQQPFDWNTFVQDEFATDEPNGILRIWNRYAAPFDLLRHPSIEALYRMLGFYQAEGSKSEGAGDFSFANTNVALIKNVIENLHNIGIPRDCLYAEVLQGNNESPESAKATYASLNLEVASVRPRSGRGGSAYVVHAHNSKAFKRLICRALDYIAKNEFPSIEAAREYAFGWLDGDGSITLTNTDTKLRLAGLEAEIDTEKRALATALKWNLSTSSANYKNSKEGARVELSIERLADLLRANAFPFSMNRVRILLGFDKRARNLAIGNDRGPFVRWGLRTHSGSLTQKGKYIVETYLSFSEEIEKARQLLATAPGNFGVKGAPLPLQFKRG